MVLYYSSFSAVVYSVRGLKNTSHSFQIIYPHVFEYFTPDNICSQAFEISRLDSKQVGSINEIDLIQSWSGDNQLMGIGYSASCLAITSLWVSGTVPVVWR